MAHLSNIPNTIVRLTGFMLVTTIMHGCATSASTQTGLSQPSSALSTTVEAIEISEKEADSITTEDIINRDRSNVKRSGEVYLMRGLANVFSRGIDQMTAELQTRGYDASNFSHAQWEPIAADIADRAARGKASFPIIVVGHSLGGNESSKFANFLATNNVPVSLVVTFDPVEQGIVGPKIDNVVNYYLPKSQENTIIAGPGFTGKIENIDVTSDPDASHVNVDKNPKYQQAVYAKIAKITKPQKRRKSRSVRFVASDR